MKCYVYSHKDFDRLCKANGWDDNHVPEEAAFISIGCTDGSEELFKFIVANLGKNFFILCSAGKSRCQAVCKVITTIFSDYETRPDNLCLYPNAFVSNKLLRLFYKG